MRNLDGGKDDARTPRTGALPLTPMRLSKAADEAIDWIVTQLNRSCAPGERRWTRTEVVEQAVFALQTAVRRWA